jgi:oligoendopeptidase F
MLSPVGQEEMKLEGSFMSEVLNDKYYLDDNDLNDVEALEDRLKELINRKIQSVADLEAWLDAERILNSEIQEAMIGHQIDFYRDTENTQKRDIHMRDQKVVQPLLLKYEAEFNKKSLDCPFVDQLDDRNYGLIKRIKQSKLELFREENIPLTVRETELGAKYSEIMGGLTIEWDDETKPYPFVRAQIDNLDRSIRERAWRALAEAHKRVKRQIDEIMDELVRLRHQMALNAGFENYRDYMFKVKNRAYSVQDCYDFHAAVEKYIVPTWNRLANVFQSELGVDTYRPWDSGAKMLRGAPFSTVTELMDGVQEMLGKTDPYFEERFKHMRENGLLDLESRQGKSPGGFEFPLRASKNAFVFANIAPSFGAIIALLHEIGHAVNAYTQFLSGNDFDEFNIPVEVSELYSHGMELLLLDKLDTFYPDDREFINSQREELRRAFGLLLGPLSSDLFQHWMYTHPNHTSQQRDEKYLEISKRYMDSPVEMSDLESDVALTWIGTIHYFQYPFYAIEYSMSELGALRLLEIYRNDPKKAVALYKQGAGTDLNQSIADIYRDTGVEFDFSEPVIKRTAEFLEKAIEELK